MLFRSAFAKKSWLDYAPSVDTSVDEDIAVLYCLTLSHNGHKDWRLPIRDEFDDSGDIWFDGKNFSNIHGEVKWRVQPVRTKEDL